MKVVIGEDPKVLQFAGSKISEVTIAFNSRALIVRDEPLIIATSLDATIRCHYIIKCLQGQIVFFFKLFVPVSYRNRRFDGCFLINDGIAFQNGDYIFRLYKS